jgi:two-component system, NarL family, sensor histidine kinase DevS
MQGVSTTPFRATIGVALICLLTVVAAVTIVRSPPWLGLDLTPDPASSRLAVSGIDAGGPAASALGATGRAPAWLKAINGQPLTDIDRIEESDFLPSYADVDSLFIRQAAAMDALRAGPVQLDFEDSDGRAFRVEVTPADRPLADLPVLFWLQLFFGGGALFVGGWLWSLRPRDLAVRMFALTGAGLALATAPAAIYSSRELAIDGVIFRML